MFVHFLKRNLPSFPLMINKIFSKRHHGSEQRLDEILKYAVTEENGILKSSSDTRTYKSIVLTNKLEALLISDPKTDNAAAALAVNVGSFSDPVEIPGLAHFLEHMLFMGNEEFPDESEYFEYLSKNGGYANAYTALEITNYQFQIISTQLYPTLKRFSAFFKKPLFASTSTEKEMKAVDNECTGNEQHDGWREYLVNKDLARANHPFRKFSIGNLETLRDEPKRKGIDVREELLKFYATFYSANRMKLVVFGKESVDKLSEIVVELFSSIPNKDINSPYTVSNELPAFSLASGNVMKLVRMVPVKDIRKIELNWYMKPSTYSNKRIEAGHYLASLLGDEGEGSILSFLKGMNWANSLSAYLESDNFDASTFSVSIMLTDLGMKEHQREVIAAVFNYIALLQQAFKDPKSCSYFFEDQKVISAIRFWFKSEAPPLQSCVSLAAKMHKDLTSKEILTGGVLLVEEAFKECSELLSELVVENLNIFSSWKEHEKDADRIEPYFKTKYQVLELNPKLYSSSPFVFHLPAKNSFIPTNFEIHPFEKVKSVRASFKEASIFLKNTTESEITPSFKKLNHNEIEDKRGVVLDTLDRVLSDCWDDCDTFRRPVLISSDSNALLWFKQDTTFKKPKAVVNIFLKNSKANESLFSLHALVLYNSLVADVLNEITYSAQVAGFTHSISTNDNGILLSFSGFSQTLDKYISLVAKTFKNYLFEKVDEAKRLSFNRLKEERLKKFSNIEKERPVALARLGMSEGLLEKMESLERKIAVLVDLELDSVLDFTKLFFTSVAVETFVTGNVTQKEALLYFDTAREVFSPTRLVSEYEFLRTLKLPKRSQIFYITPGRNSENQASGIAVRFDFGERNVEKAALLSAFSDLCGQKTFNQLRTKEQLGYLVQSFVTVENGVLSLNFLIESNNSDPIVLNSRVENFLDLFKVEMEKLDAEVYNTMVNAYINKLYKRETTLQSEAYGWLDDILSGLYLFDNKFLLATYLAKSTLDDLKYLLNAYLWKDSPERAKFVSGMLADVHGTKLFGEEYRDKIKPAKRQGVFVGFEKDFVTEWLHRDEQMFKEFVQDRGEIEVVESLTVFKEKSAYHPTYPEIILSNL